MKIKSTFAHDLKTNSEVINRNKYYKTKPLEDFSSGGFVRAF